MTQETYAQVKTGTPIEQLGGISNAMAIRHVAAHAYYETEEELVDAARKTMFTHRDTDALGGGEFFARVTHRVINGATPLDAIESVAAQMGGFFEQKAAQAIANAEMEKAKMKAQTDAQAQMLKQEEIKLKNELESQKLALEAQQQQLDADRQMLDIETERAKLEADIRLREADLAIKEQKNVITSNNDDMKNMIQAVDKMAKASNG